MVAVINLVTTVISLYIWVLVINAALSWLVAFNVINTRNRLVYTIGDITFRLTEPVLRPIRRMLPLIGGIDLSPVIAILALVFIRDLLIFDLIRFVH